MASHFFKGLGATVLGIFKETKKAKFIPASGQPQSIEVVFSNRHKDIDASGKEVGAPKPTAWIKTGVIDPNFNDILNIDFVSYLIVEIKPDGHEITELVLQENGAC